MDIDHWQTVIILKYKQCFVCLWIYLSISFKGSDLFPAKHYETQYRNLTFIIFGVKEMSSRSDIYITNQNNLIWVNRLWNCDSCEIRDILMEKINRDL